MTNTINLTQTHVSGPGTEPIIGALPNSHVVRLSLNWLCLHICLHVFTPTLLFSTLAGDISCCRGQWLMQEFTTGQNTKNDQLQVLSPK